MLDLGIQPLHAIADMFVLDMTTHRRYDILAPRGPINRQPPPLDHTRLEPSVTWLLDGIPTMGTGGIPGRVATPRIPLFIGQGANGTPEGTPGNKPGIGPGDGVMIAGDVRTLARDYCAKGCHVHYEPYDTSSHISSLVTWLPNSIAWIKQRFAGLPAPQNCSSIPPGNPIPPIPVP